METHEDPYKPHHNLAAAKELLNRGWSMPNAVECSWLCAHHVSAEYFNGQKSQESRNGHNPSKKVDNTTPSTAQDTENSDSDPSAPEADTAQVAVAVEDSPEASPEPAGESDHPELVEGSKDTKKSFTDIDSLPDRFWMNVLDLCERLEERGRIPPLPLGPDDLLPNIDGIKVVDFPEVDLTDDDVAARFWARVGEQIEIQEDWGELSPLQSGTSRTLHLGVGLGPHPQRVPTTPGSLTQIPTSSYRRRAGIQGEDVVVVGCPLSLDGSLPRTLIRGEGEHHPQPPKSRRTV